MNNLWIEVFGATAMRTAGPDERNSTACGSRRNRRSVASARGDDEPALAIASATYRHIGAMPQAGIRAHSGTVQRLVGPVDLARFDSTVKVPTEGSGRTSRHPGRRVPVRSLCDGPGVHSAGSAPMALGRSAGIIGGSASAMEPAFPFTWLERHRPSFRMMTSTSVVPAGIARTGIGQVADVVVHWWGAGWARWGRRLLTWRGCRRAR